MNNYAYVLDGVAYLNITNRCSNACSFCIRNTGSGVRGTPLWLSKEPTASEVMAAYDKIKGEVKSDEVVYCGFGEPTDNIEVLSESAKAFKAMGKRLRLNTNGLGEADNGRDVTDDLSSIDVISISLNQCDAKKYYDVTKCKYGLKGFDYMLEFAKKEKAAGKEVVFTVVDTISKQDIESCKRLAAGVNIPLRVREYIADNYGGGKE